jgi:hypothetical protein
MKNLIFIGILYILLINEGCKSSISDYQDDSRIYKMVLDTIPYLLDLKVEITPTKLKRIEALNELYAKDVTLYFEQLKRNMAIPYYRESPNFHCDTCIYVSYIYSFTTPMYVPNALKKSEFTLKNNISWSEDTLQSISFPYYDYQSPLIKYISLTDERLKNMSSTESFHPIDSLNRLLYTNYGNYYLGKLLFSRVLYSIDNQYAFLFVEYNKIIIGSFYFYKKTDKWKLMQFIEEYK